MSGPSLPASEEIHAMKYRQSGESFEQAMARIAGALKDNDDHFHAFKEILMDMRFLPAGRVQAAVGSTKIVTPYNCFVSDEIPDSMAGIMDAAKRAAETMRLGGGIGYDFSSIRPRGARISTLDTQASGPVSYMHIFDAVCKTIASAGHRRGAQMGVLRVDHPDIEEFIRAKRNDSSLTAFNISVGITDKFMQAVESKEPFPLIFGDTVYRYVDAYALWEEIMRSNWDWAEPGVLFIDAINRQNNLWYAETISATNPCAEQPLPPNGACLLGSFNVTKYVTIGREFDFNKFAEDIAVCVRAMDNVIDEATYPLPEHEAEAKSKRRMGLGVTGVANAIEAMGYPYGSLNYCDVQSQILRTLRDTAYETSVVLAKEKGPFPLYNQSLYARGEFVRRLPHRIRHEIWKHGIRNSHLTSIAPTGTISFTADNISSGIEPTFARSQKRLINTPDGMIEVNVPDYGVDQFGTWPKTADKCSVDDHVRVLVSASKYVDSAVSKTCNVGDDVSWGEFKGIYERAYKEGVKGCTTFRLAGKRFGILSKTDEEEPQACYIDPETGNKTCDE